MQYDSANWRFNFANNVRTIYVKDKVTQSNFDFTEVQFYLDNAQEDLWTCGAGGWSLAVFDNVSGNPIPSYSVFLGITTATSIPTWNGNAGNCIFNEYSNNITYDFGLLNVCLNNNDLNWERKMATFIAGIPNGTPVLAYTENGYYGPYSPGAPIYNPWLNPTTPALKAALHSIGSIKIDSLRDTTSLIIFEEKA